MKYVDEFRDPVKAKGLTDKIKQAVEQIMRTRDKPLHFMEFCGGHTHTVFRFGIEQMLPEGIELVHGPGCPVCVLPRGRVDDCIRLTEIPNVIFATFGDAMRVPGSKMSLLQAKAQGADVRMVYSPLDALKLAQQNPDKEVIFFALGFETTMPSTALTVLEAKRSGISNFSLFCNHITTAPTIKAVLDTPGVMVDGFIAPGHVAMVVGTEPFDFIARDYHRPIVITGFEPLDILQSIYMLVRQMANDEARVENQYERVVQRQGNDIGMEAMAMVYTTRLKGEYRGLGAIDGSGVAINSTYADYDAEAKFNLELSTLGDPADCGCGDVLKGAIKPWQCPLFGSKCTPESPLGALMVSSEGACAAYYSYVKPADVAKLRARHGVDRADKNSVVEV